MVAMEGPAAGKAPRSACHVRDDDPLDDAPAAGIEAARFDYLVFHATGTGGRTMESLIEAGLVSGVLDVTTTEGAGTVVGGIFPDGPHLRRDPGTACLRSCSLGAWTW